MTWMDKCFGPNSSFRQCWHYLHPLYFPRVHFNPNWGMLFVACPCINSVIYVNWNFKEIIRIEWRNAWKGLNPRTFYLPSLRASFVLLRIKVKVEGIFDQGYATVVLGIAFLGR